MYIMWNTIYVYSDIVCIAKNKIRVDTILKFYTTMATSVLLYGCDNWILRKEDMSRVAGTETKFFRRLKVAHGGIELEI